LNRTIDKDDEQAWWMGLRNPNEEDEDDDSELSDEDETDAGKYLIKILNHRGALYNNLYC